MTYWYEFEVVLNGTVEEKAAMLEVIGSYQDEREEKSIYISSVEINCVPFNKESISSYLSTPKIVIKAYGPFGQFDKIKDVDIFRDLAQAAPNACFKGLISGGSSYTSEEIACELKDGLLTIDTFFDTNDDQDKAWRNDLVSKLPYEDFVRLFKIEGSLEEDTYPDLINEFSYTINNGVIEYSYKEFCDCLDEFYGLSSKLSKDEYNELRTSIAKERCLKSEGQFIDEDYTGGKKEHLIYDPVNKVYK